MLTVIRLKLNYFIYLAFKNLIFKTLKNDEIFSSRHYAKMFILLIVVCTKIFMKEKEMLSKLPSRRKKLFMKAKKASCFLLQISIFTKTKIINIGNNTERF